MCKLKKTRKELNVPEWVQKEYQKRNKAEMAQMLMDCNWDKAGLTSSEKRLKDAWIAEMEIIVKRKSTTKTTIDEQWLSERDMKEEYNWNALNRYDGIEEFYVIVAEKGTREQEETKEEIRRKHGREHEAPSIADGDFADLEMAKGRKQVEAEAAAVPPDGGATQNQRHEVGECQLTKMDKEYDECNNALAQGEVSGFNDEFIANATAKMKAATLVNTKKYEKKDESVVKPEPEEERKPKKRAKGPKEEEGEKKPKKAKKAK
eukprot:s491_g17.t1